MPSISLYSSHSKISNALNEIKEGLNGVVPSLLIYFASPSYDPHELSEAFQQTFPSAQTVGCTTSGEIVSGKMLTDSLVVMAFPKEMIGDFEVEVIENIDSHAKKGVAKAFENFATQFKSSPADWSHEEYVGMIFIDGLSMSEERINNLIGNQTGVQFVGGSAGDNLAFQHTYVFANGKAYTNAAVLTLVKPNVKFSILKTQSFQSTYKTLRVTKADESSRRIISFDGKPALKAYAEALGISQSDAESYFHKHPMGLVLDADNIFVRSPRKVENDDMLFYCAVGEGMELHVLQGGDIVDETARMMELKKQEMGHISSIINFNCILRALELREKDQEQAYADLFADTPTVGFNTYGESYIGHINQTATMLLFKE